MLSRMLLYLGVWTFVGSCASNPEKESTMNHEQSDIPEVPTSQASLVYDAKASLGEGALWHRSSGQLYWVDIEGKQLHRYSPATQQNETFPMPSRIGTVVLDSDGNAIVALQNGIHRYNFASDSLALLVNPLDTLPNVRFNDGKCDPQGRLWVGSMHLEQTPKAASLYKVEGKQATVMLEDITISNGIVWTSDRTKMYYIDTPTLTIMEYAFDAYAGTLSSARVAVKVPEAVGYPDGMSIDTEDKLWVAHWGGNAVIRWDPITGEMLHKVEVPAPHVTSCAFGGEDLTTLYITTAREGLTNEQLSTFPQSGGLFKTEVNVAGQETYLFNDSPR